MESYDLTTGTFSGTSKRLFYFSIAAFVAGAAMLVAGSVMLGVGIHKYNQNVDAAAVVPETTATTPQNNSYITTTGPTTIGTGVPLTPTGTASPTGTAAPPTGTGAPPTGSEAPPTGSPGPTGAPDILIMLDTSREIGVANFNQIIDYIATAIAPKLPLGGSASYFFDRAGDQTNVGIVGFSDASVNIMSYYEISDLASVRDALSDLTLSNAKTNPSKALTVMNKFGFTKVDNTNVMMVLASGTQADLDAAADALSQFQSAIQNFTFVALGKAGALNLSNFSNSDNVHIFMSENYVLTPEETNDLINGLNPTGATAVPVTVPPPPPGPTCNMDIAILIDQSVTVGTVDDFNRQIDYLAKSLVYSWNISYTAIETFGLLYSQFGTNLLSTKPFNYNATSEFIADLIKVKGKDPLGPNDIVGGLNSLQSHLTNRRPSFGLTTILITYSSEFDFNAAVTEVKNIGGNLIVVAVNTDPTNLYYLSGTVIETKKFFYDNITSQINAALCAPPVPPSPLPTMPYSSASPTSSVTGPTRHGVSIYTLQTITPQTTTTTTRPPSTNATGPISSTVTTTTGPTSPTTTVTGQPPSTSTPAVPYIPCQSWIYFGVDDSNVLQDNQFMAQLNFVSSAVGNVTHPERIAAVGMYSQPASWNSGLTISQIQAAVTAVSQSGPYSLRNQFASLATNLQDIQTNNVPVGALIFISDTSDSALAAASNMFGELPSNIRITFVLLGNNVDQTKLTQFSNNFITWTDLLQPQPTNWNNLYGPAYGCTGELSTLGPTSTSVTPPSSTSSIASPTSTIPTSTIPLSSTSVLSTSTSTPSVTTSGQTSPTSPQSTTTGTTPTIPYIPCQSWISLGFDDSNKLDPTSFTNQLNFVSSAVGNITHPERIAVNGMYSQPAAWNSGLTISQIQQAITSTSQSGPYNLRLQFSYILTNSKSATLNNNPVGALIFISDTSDSAIAGADQIFGQLPSNIRITFVLLGNGVDQSKLTKYSSNFISWPNLSQPQPDNWNNLYGPAYGCSGGISTLIPTSTVTTVIPSSSSLASSSTVVSSTSVSSPSSPQTSTTSPTSVTSPTSTIQSSSTSPQTTTTPAVPYIPCQSWISFGTDDSSNLDLNSFTKQLNFISSAVGNITHPERVEVVGMYSQPVIWNSGLTIPQIQNAVVQMFQGGTYNLRSQFAALLNNLQNIQINNVPVGAIIFISDTSDSAIAGADQIFGQLPSNIRITFVLLGSGVDQSKLTKYSSNFISWPNLSQPQPDNWNNLYGPAYGCSGGISTLIPTSTVTTVIPSSSSLASSSTVVSSTSVSSPSSPQTSTTSPTSVTSPTSTIQSSSTSPQTTTTPAVPYIPCQSWISFGTDDSSNLDLNSFTKQLNFISSAVGNITHPERVEVVGMYSQPVIWNSGLTIPQIQNAVVQMFQGGTYNLRSQFAALLNNLQNIQINNVPVGAIIFISDTSDSAIAGADQIFGQLPSNIRITFVLLGSGVDQSKLTKYSSNFISWPNLSQSQPDNWNNLYGPAYGCTGGISTFSPTSTITTITQSSSSSTSPSSTLTISSTIQTTASSISTSISQSTGPTSTPAPGSYYPCQNWVSVVADNSNKITKAQFQAQLNFVKLILGQMTHPERIRYGTYDAQRGNLLYPFNPNNTQNGLQQAIDSTNQTTFGANVLKAIQLLVADENQNRTTPDSTLIFVTDTSNPTQIQAAVELYNRDLKNIGIKLTFILAGQNLNANALSGFTDAIIYNWQNIGFFAQPDGWDLSTAFRCTAASSTTGGSTMSSTVTQTSPSTVPSTSTSLSSTVTSTTTSTITSTGGPISPTSPSDYIPCHSWISFNIDDSNTLSTDNYNKQLNFISAVIGDINHPERIQAIGAYDQPVFWNSHFSVADIQTAVKALPQEGAYRLRQQFAELLTGLESIQTNNAPVGALIFVSDTSDAALQDASAVFSLIQNVRITFVLLGPNADQNKLTNFSSNFINWKDLSQPQPDNWSNLYGPAYGCTPLSSTTIGSTITGNTPSSSTTVSTLPSTSTAATPSSPPPGDYIPCKSSIVFALDASNNNGDMEFAAMKTLVTKNIVAQNWTHFERVGLMSYADASSCTYEYGTFGSKQNFDNTVNNNIAKFASSNSITFGMGTLMNTFVDLPLNYQNTIFFTSTSDPADVAQAATNSVIIDYRGALIIVAIYPASKQNLLPLVAGDASKIIEFNPLSTIGYDVYAARILSKFDCGQTTSTSPPPSTISSTITPQATTTATGPISTTTTVTRSPSSASTPAVPYIPCQSWIYFGVDDSNVLQNNNFMTQLNFVSSAVGNVTHPERIAAVGMYSQPASWNSGLTISQIQAAVTAVSQSGPYSLRNQFASLATNLQATPINNVPVGALIFISDTSDQALRGADQIFGQLPSNVRITFVLLGSSVDQSKLTKYSSNFISWPNLSQSQPDNWNNLYGPAYGCSEGISTVSSISTVTTVLPSSSSVSSPASAVTVSSSVSSTTQTVPSSSSVTTASQTPITSTTGSTPSAGDYVPCQVLITALVDISNALTVDQFQKQLTFTKNFMSQINHPERIQFGAYFQTRGNMTYKWNDTNTQEGLQQAIDNTVQSSESTSLAGAMRVLMNNGPLNRTIPDSTIIFVTDTTNSIQIQQAVNLYNSALKGRVRITFILAGNKTDATALNGFTEVIFFYWQNMNKSQPDGWDISQALRCTSLSSTSTGNTVSPSTTISTQGSSASTSMSPSTMTSVQSATTASSGYIPCQSWIYFGVDDSTALRSSDFMTQLNFISSAIGNITHPERIAAVGMYSQPASWNSGLTVSQIQSAVTLMSQNGPYMLRNLFASLLTNLQSNPTNNVPVAALIFISDTSNSALAGAANIFGQLPTNIKITFVLLSQNSDPLALTQFSNNFIYWRDLSQSQPVNWDAEATAAYGCTTSTASTVTPITMSSLSSVSPTRGGITVHTVQTVPPQTSLSTSASISTSASSVASSTTGTATINTTPEPYVPCQSWISFSYDDSNKLPNSDFKTQMAFISSAINGINYPERIRAEGGYSSVATWNSHQTKTQIQNELNNKEQTPNSYSLLQEFGYLVTNLALINSGNTWPIGALVFISDTSDNATRYANRYIPQLSNVTLTFVLLGNNADSSKLTQFTNNFIYWPDLSQPQPDNWDASFFDAYGCNGLITHQPPSTLSTASSPTTQSTSLPSTSISTSTVASSTTSNIPTTSITYPSTSISLPSTASSIGTPPTTLIPYLPCQSWISFSYDDSSKLLNADFKKQMAFIANATIPITYPERLRVNGVFTPVASWNSHQTNEQIYNEIINVEQTGNDYSLLQEFLNLLTDFEALGNSTTWPIGSLIFISDTSDRAIQNANHFFPLLNGVKITFVLLGPDADQTKLTQYSNNFIYWSDLSQPQPDNWDALSYAAYGCSAKYII